MPKPTTTELSINTIQLKKAALVIRSVNHKLRQQLLHLIHKSGEVNVTTIYTKAKLEQSVASQHLAILRRAGFVVTKRNGKSIYYSVNYERLQDVHNQVRLLLS